MATVLIYVILISHFWLKDNCGITSVFVAEKHLNDANFPLWLTGEWKNSTKPIEIA